MRFTVDLSETSGSQVSLRVVMPASIVRIGSPGALNELLDGAVVFGFIARFGKAGRNVTFGRFSPTGGTRAGSGNGIFGLRCALRTRNSLDDLQGGILPPRRDRRAQIFAPKPNTSSHEAGWRDHREPL